MKGLRSIIKRVCCTTLAVALLVFAPGGGGVVAKELVKKETGPIVIKSKTLEVNDKLKRVIFTGDVSAKGAEFVINCEKMVVYYKGTPGQKGSEGKGAVIEKIVATGHVTINRSEGGTATSEKAVYDHGAEKLVLTGHPLLKRGNDFVQGDRIIIYLKENRSLVESSEHSRVKAMIFPGKWDKKVEE